MLRLRYVTVAELEALRKEGLVRFIGVSTTNPDLADPIAMGVIDVIQVPYSVVEREHERPVHKAVQAGAGAVIPGGVARADGGAVRQRSIIRYLTGSPFPEEETPPLACTPACTSSCST